MIDFSCISMMIPGESLRQRIENASRWGFRALELVIAEADNTGPAVKEAKSILHDQDIRVSGLIYDHHFLNKLFDGSRATRGKCLQNIMAGIDLASELGSNFIWTPEYASVAPPPLYEPFDPTYGGRFDSLLTNLGKLASHAQQCGVLIFLEPINRYESTFFHTLQEGKTICEKVGLTSLRLLADFFHMNIEEADMNRSLYGSRRFIRHIHLSDSNRHLPGYGHIDFISAFSTLLDMGYSGYLTLECRIDGPADQQLPQCLAFLKSCLVAAQRIRQKSARQ